MSAQRTVFGLVAAVLLVTSYIGLEPALGRGEGARSIEVASSSRSNSDGSSAQALRTCVDRWNQGNMLGWGPTLARVSVRRLNARERADLGFRGRLRVCALRLAVHSSRDPRTGCSGGAVMPGHPNSCVYRASAWVCVMNSFGAYVCPSHSDDGLSLSAKNGSTDQHGVMKLDFPLQGTHATPALAWQRRYPHTDGWIEPWSGSGVLRSGLRLDKKIDRGGGTCSQGSEQTVAKSAVRCLLRGVEQRDPCFPQKTDWNHRGRIVACSTSPGARLFGRFVVSKRL